MASVWLIGNNHRPSLHEAHSKSSRNTGLGWNPDCASWPQTSYFSLSGRGFTVKWGYFLDCGWQSALSGDDDDDVGNDEEEEDGGDDGEDDEDDSVDEEHDDDEENDGCEMMTLMTLIVVMLVMIMTKR